ncbi:fibronectin type III domain-containing protein [Eggerthellaceae bacterium 24-137]
MGVREKQDVQRQDSEGPLGHGEDGGGQTLKEGRDYTVSSKAGKSVGSYNVTVTGKGSYAGTKTAAFKINPKGTSAKKLKKAKRGFTATWKKPSKTALKQTTGYQVRYSLKKSMKGAKTKTVKATSSAGKKCTLKVSKLKGGKKYYVQVRTYKKAGGKTYYSGWSKAKAVKTKK